MIKLLCVRCCNNYDYDAVLMTGPTSIMHFCGLATVTVVGGIKNPNGVNEAVVLHGKDEYRL